MKFEWDGYFVVKDGNMRVYHDICFKKKNGEEN